MVLKEFSYDENNIYFIYLNNNYLNVRLEDRKSIGVEVQIVVKVYYEETRMWNLNPHFAD